MTYSCDEHEGLKLTIIKYKKRNKDDIRKTQINYDFKNDVSSYFMQNVDGGFVFYHNCDGIKICKDMFDAIIE